MKRFINQFISTIIIGGGYVAGGLIALMSAIVTYEVIVRYVFNSPTSWSVELTNYSLPIMTLLGAAYCLYIRRHIRVVLLVDKLSGRAQVLLEAVASLIGLLFSLTLLWKSGQWVLDTYQVGEVSSTVLMFPQWIVRLSFPLGMFLLSVQFLKDLMVACRRSIQSNPIGNS
jgi:C4-dicarboxylate transporter, DctQ subunit